MVKKVDQTQTAIPEGIKCLQTILKEKSWKIPDNEIRKLKMFLKHDSDHHFNLDGGDTLLTCIQITPLKVLVNLKSGEVSFDQGSNLSVDKGFDLLKRNYNFYIGELNLNRSKNAKLFKESFPAQKYNRFCIIDEEKFEKFITERVTKMMKARIPEFLNSISVGNGDIFSDFVDFVDCVNYNVKNTVLFGGGRKYLPNILLTEDERKKQFELDVYSAIQSENNIVINEIFEAYCDKQYNNFYLCNSGYEKEVNGVIRDLIATDKNVSYSVLAAKILETITLPSDSNGSVTISDECDFKEFCDKNKVLIQTLIDSDTPASDAKVVLQMCYNLLYIKLLSFVREGKSFFVFKTWERNKHDIVVRYVNKSVGTFSKALVEILASYLSDEKYVNFLKEFEKLSVSDSKKNTDFELGKTYHLSDFTVEEMCDKTLSILYEYAATKLTNFDNSIVLEVNVKINLDAKDSPVIKNVQKIEPYHKKVTFDDDHGIKLDLPHQKIFTLFSKKLNSTFYNFDETLQALKTCTNLIKGNPGKLSVRETVEFDTDDEIKLFEYYVSGLESGIYNFFSQEEYSILLDFLETSLKELKGLNK